MRGIGCLLLPLLALGPAAGAGIAVRESQGKIDVAAAAAPLADVLDRLAHQIGMKVVYEGPAPRQLVTLSLVGRSPAEAVTAILEGQGLNYALVLDATATRVEKLLVTGATPAGFGHSPGRAVAPALERSRVLRPDNDPEPEEVPEEPPPAPEPPAPEAPIPAAPGTPAPQKAEPSANPPGSPNPPATATPAPTPPGMVTPPPGLPAFPTSPFNPSLVPMPTATPAPPSAQPTPKPPAEGANPP
jgi:hypothetical protein